MIERTSPEVKAHRAQIDAIVARWQDGEFGMPVMGMDALRRKRQAIRELNTFFYGDRTQVAAKRRLVAVSEPEPELVTTVSVPTLDEEQEEFWWKRES